ncbi:aromatic compound dioxygenase [Stereum hirsutum FP-91666 SS1]|uniref:aromatic compound dioxygenase n=1 Tax=Stereum hirsutum (strain FP-91666) TaxID=721885 RepID=UPI000440A8F2|nr:aromatic compound dioxygenase [Stereum hirsutum FP-91666 SS1]EIM88812.1 aromatic compound dioxygenase [Stereum hirsutum FP-91666 SS1]
MIYTPFVTLLGAVTFATVFAHPERMTPEIAKREIGVATGSCAEQISARREATLERRRASLFERRMANGHVTPIQARSLEERNKYATIQNDTCVLSPDTIWGPYGIDGELYRHDVREGQEGIDFYLDIGVIDVETCEPLPNAYLGIWNSNASGTYGGFTGIDPNTAELRDGWSTQADGTTDETTFLRGVMSTDETGIAEFLTIFPGYYITRTTHIHVTVQTNVTDDDYSYGDASVQHIGQIFFDEDLINAVYETSPYSDHLSTLNRTLTDVDSVYTVAATAGYSPVVSVEKLGDDYEDGLVGYITIGVNTSAAGLATTGNSVNPQGYLPTVTLSASAQASASSVDAADGYWAATTASV